jgi:hypothetical protein
LGGGAEHLRRRPGRGCGPIAKALRHRRGGVGEPYDFGRTVGFGQDTPGVEFIDRGQPVRADHRSETDTRNHRDALKHRWVWFGHVMDYSKSLAIAHDDR